jgi:hypothetical protein
MKSVLNYILMGKSVVGAAATAVVTSAVGCPVVMGTILVGGTVLLLRN